MRYRWRLRGRSTTDSAFGPKDAEAVRELVRSINVPESIAAILVERGVRTFEEARDYFRPSLEQLHDPYLMDDMSRAVERIRQAIAMDERITIYGDYDVDGTTSTAMLTLFLRSIGAHVAYHIPDRFKEGYGLSIAGLDRAIDQAEEKPNLIITIDCGITAIEQVAYARAKGVDVIICDHHEPADTLPAAFAILNPIKGSCDYPYKNLCGCGVGFKLIQAISQAIGEPERCNAFLDFVALASSADIVSLVGENRILTSFGLKLINSTPRPGIKALMNAAHLRVGKVGTTQIVFGLAPRINAAGRLGDGSRAVKLLMSETDDEAHHHAAELEFENSNRRRIDEEAFYEACEFVEGTLNRVNDKIIVLHNPAWHAGVIGIVASRLVERYHLPVVLLTTIDGIAKGSARSINGFDIHSAIKRCEDKVVTFGGHKYAAGVSIAIDRVPEFRTAINLVATEMISEEMLQPEIEVDAQVDLNELTPKYFAIVRQFSPFGPNNLRPTFYAKNVEVTGYPRIVGKTTPHLKFQVRSAAIVQSMSAGAMSSNVIPFTMGGGVIEAIGFGLGTRLNELLGPNGRGRKDLEIVFYLEENDYDGRVTPQLVVRDFK